MKTAFIEILFAFLIAIGVIVANNDDATEIDTICVEFAKSAINENIHSFDEQLQFYLVEYFCGLRKQEIPFFERHELKWSDSDEAKKDSPKHGIPHEPSHRIPADEQKSLGELMHEETLATDEATKHNNFGVFAENLFTTKLWHKFRVNATAFIKSLSKLEPLKGLSGKSDSALYRSHDRKFILKSLEEPYEPKAMEATLEKYAAHMIRNSEQSLLSKFYLIFRVPIGKSDEPTGKPKKIAFVIMNDIFEVAGNAKLLKFYLKGTFSPGSAVQFDQQQPWYKEKHGPGPYPNSVYREFDFLGLPEKQVEPFFTDGIELEDKDDHKMLADALKRDVKYLTENNLNDYSLLLGVHFVENDHNEGEHIKRNKHGEVGLAAKCSRCKSAPDAEYKNDQKLRLFLGIADILTPFDEERQALYVKMLKKRRSKEFEPWLTTMDHLGGIHLENVSPVPTDEFARRFVGSITGCMLRWSSSALDGPPRSEHEAARAWLENVRHGLISTVCASLGTDRHIHELTARGQPARMDWMRDPKFRQEFVGRDGEFRLRNYGFGVFKELMESKWEARAYDLLEAFADLRNDKNEMLDSISIGDKFVATFIPKSEQYSGVVPRIYPLDFFQYHIDDYFWQTIPLPKYFALFGVEEFEDAEELMFCVTEVPEGGFLTKIVNNIKSSVIF